MKSAMSDEIFMPTCSTCAFSDDGPSPADQEEWLLCRRHAPAVFAAANDGFDGGAGVFPRVTPGDWCGEWLRCPINTGIKGVFDFRDFLAAERPAEESPQRFAKV